MNREAFRYTLSAHGAPDRVKNALKAALARKYKIGLEILDISDQPEGECEVAFTLKRSFKRHEREAAERDIMRALGSGFIYRA